MNNPDGLIKIVGLDIDGVCNSSRYHNQQGDLPMGTAGALDPQAIRLLNIITDRPNVWVLLISSWRAFGLAKVEVYLRTAGWQGRLIGSTPSVRNGERRAEILEWFQMAERMGWEHDRAVMIDDGGDVDLGMDLSARWRCRHVWTNHAQGLNRAGVDQALGWLLLPAHDWGD